MRIYIVLLFSVFPLLSANDIAQLRLDDYRDFMNKISSKPKIVQIEQVNAYFNRIVNDYDTHIWGQEDYWATPKEFIVRGGGDCEDFVFAKYFTLKALGFTPSSMMIYIVKVHSERDFHAVLGVRNDQNETLILDNLSWKVLPIQKRTDLHILYDLNDPRLSKATDPLTRHIVASYRNLLQKIDNGQ